MNGRIAEENGEKNWARSRGLAVRAEDSRLRCRGFKSCRILDGLLAITYTLRKKKNKGTQMGHTKKKKKKKKIWRKKYYRTWSKIAH
jgi:hypothetical protein